MLYMFYINYSLRCVILNDFWGTQDVTFVKKKKKPRTGLKPVVENPSENI